MNLPVQRMDLMKPELVTDRIAECGHTGRRREDRGTEAVIYTCPSCGAQIVTDATTAATFCYYCHNPVVLSGRLSGNYMPNKVIPFAIDRKEAEKRFYGICRQEKVCSKGIFQ